MYASCMLSVVQSYLCEVVGQITRMNSSVEDTEHKGESMECMYFIVAVVTEYLQQQRTVLHVDHVT